MGDVPKHIIALREHNARAPIHRRFSNENLSQVFLALALIDTPTKWRPQGWFIQVNGVCHLWREVAVHCVELWAFCAGSFPSKRMTDLAIERAQMVPWDLKGHVSSPWRVLTGYQLSLIEKHAARLRSLVHEDHANWEGLFSRTRSFPQLETANIWNDSYVGPSYKHIDTPRLMHLRLRLDSAPIRFIAPALRSLILDVDNSDWREWPLKFPEFIAEDEIPNMTSHMSDLMAFLQRSPVLERLILTNTPRFLSEGISDRSWYIDLPHLEYLCLSTSIIPFNAPALRFLCIDMDGYNQYTKTNSAVFPITELITFLQCTPRLERLTVTGIPRPPLYGLIYWYELRIELPCLRVIYLEGHPTVISKTLQHLKLPVDVHTFINASPVSTSAEYDGEILRDIIQNTFHPRSLYCSRWPEHPTSHGRVRFGITGSSDLFLQVCPEGGSFDRDSAWAMKSMDASFGQGPSFTLKIPVQLERRLETLSVIGHSSKTCPQSRKAIWDCRCWEHYQDGVSSDFYTLAVDIFGSRDTVPIVFKHLDLTDMPLIPRGSEPEDIMNLDHDYDTCKIAVGRLFQALFIPGSVSVVLNWTLIAQVLRKNLYVWREVAYPLPGCVRDVTIVNFPCASFPSRKRYDKSYNTWAWDLMNTFLYEAYPGKPYRSLKLAESASEMSELERSEEPPYVHTLQGSYGDAVRAVTAKGYERIAPYIEDFQDLRNHTYP